MMRKLFIGLKTIKLNPTSLSYNTSASQQGPDDLFFVFIFSIFGSCKLCSRLHVNEITTVFIGFIFSLCTNSLHGSEPIVVDSPFPLHVTAICSKQIVTSIVGPMKKLLKSINSIIKNRLLMV
jgi:hypothetical protein